jgi:hypothetical protein
MPKPFYNSTEAELASGAQNVVDIVTPAVATYGVTAGTMTTYAGLTTSYASLLELATEPATRTSVSIENKNVAKKALREASVNLAQIFTATSTVTNAMLLALKMNERVVPQPRPVWPYAPTIDVVKVTNRLVDIHVHDATSEGRGLPFGVERVNIFSYVGPTPPTDPAEYHFQGSSSRAKSQILFPDSVPSGATIWLSAQWVSARSQLSPGSTPISFTLQGGALPAAA